MMIYSACFLVLEICSSSNVNTITLFIISTVQMMYYSLLVLCLVAELPPNIYGSYNDGPLIWRYRTATSKSWKIKWRPMFTLLRVNSQSFKWFHDHKSEFSSVMVDSLLFTWFNVLTLMFLRQKSINTVKDGIDNIRHDIGDLVEWITHACITHTRTMGCMENRNA